MMKKNKYAVPGTDPGQPAGPFDKRERVRVSLAFYLVSILVVALVIFILMLVQYLPGYRSSYRLSKVIKNSNVSMTVKIPMAEVEKREENPFTRQQKKEVEDTLKGMGAKSANVDILPEAGTTGTVTP